jgi:TRAP-type C4-dicarboxylate transport system substrate-binding protein
MAFLFASSVAVAAEPVKIKVMAYGSRMANYIFVEEPFWSKTFPANVQGKVIADYTPQDLMGVSGDQIIRYLEKGVVDFASGDVSKLAGENPIFEGCDLAGLTLNLKDTEKACDLWKSVIDDVLQKEFNSKLLGIAPNPMQVFWCRVPIAGMADLKGKKIRVFNKSMSDFVEALGGTAVNISFQEVVPALQRGVVDCGCTGAHSGNTSGWGEVTTHQYKLSMGWSVMYWAANLKKWNTLTPDIQDLIAGQFKYLETESRKYTTELAVEFDNCNFSREPCTRGNKLKLVEVAVKDSDMATHKQIMENTVLLNWGKRVGKEGTKRWNETVGKAFNLTIPLDKI